MEQLDLSNQFLTGPIPDLSELPLLKKVDFSNNQLTGTIPQNFLESCDPNMFQYANLHSNLITGVVPTDTFSSNHISLSLVTLQNNMIESIPQSLCPSTGKSDFGCDAILCPPGTYKKATGKQEEANSPCESCQESKYYGADECPPRLPSGNTPSPTSIQVQYGRPKIPDQMVLELIYDACNGDSWKNNENWKSSSSICDWYGITCDDSGESVKNVNLPENSLQGSIPTEIFALPKLVSLRLSGNDIHMSFKGARYAINLRELDLHDTNLFDSDRLDELDALESLDISNNSFEGSLPSELFSLKNLNELKLDKNNFSGEISDEISNLKQLSSLSMSDNKLDGPLPMKLAQLTHMQTLNLRNNKFQGRDLGPMIRNMVSLKYLDVSHQTGIGLSGQVPTFHRMTNLKKLDLSDNSFSGTIPEDFLSTVDPNSFEYANLATNNLRGEIPESLQKLDNIYLQDNFITSVSEDFCHPDKSNLIKEFGCDAILCAPKSFNAFGRAASFDSPCQPCNSAKYYGATTCPPRTPYDDSSDTPDGDEDEPDMNQRDILETLYRRTGGDNWKQRDNWMKTDIDFCEWEGVTCDTGSVESINLSDNNLHGIIPTSIYKLPKLKTLTLESNSIDIDFDGIENAERLITLDLSHTDIESLNGLDKVKNLENLYLASANLRGEIPGEIFELKKLKHLSLEFNDLTGTLSVNIGNLIDLEYLAIHNNQISGPIPESIGWLNKIQFMLMRHNSFSGTLPDSLVTLNGIWFLDLGDQKSFTGRGIGGNLPSFADFKDLRRLDLSYNSFTGIVPSNFLAGVNPTTFEYVDISSNSISGELPGILARLAIDGIYFSDNQISSISDNLCDESLSPLTQKYQCNAILCPPKTYNELGKQKSDETPCRECPDKEFYGASHCGDSDDSGPVGPEDISERQARKEMKILQRFYDAMGGDAWENNDNWNDQEVSICEWFGIRCVDSTDDDDDSVQYILLSSNNLVGDLPSYIFSLVNLDTLVLDNNPIQISFRNIEKAEKLSTLDVSSTGLEHIIGISAALNLREFRATNNNMKEALPDELFNIQSLEQLALDFNRFSGSIPDRIGELKNLRLFSCASNRLTGTLPESLGNLKSMVTLHLQSNMFTGSLPRSLGEMTDLAFLDLSGQTTGGFSGKLPDFSKLQDLHRIDLSFNSLTGSIPSNFLESSNPEVVNLIDLHNNYLSGTVPATLSKYEVITIHDNKFTDIDPTLCKTNFGCEGFLCPPGKYNIMGKRTSSESTCDPCSFSKFYGMTVCDGENPGYNENSDHTSNVAPVPQIVPVPAMTSRPSFRVEKNDDGINNGVPNVAPSPNVGVPVNMPTGTIDFPSEPVIEEKEAGSPPGSDMSEREILDLFFVQCNGEQWINSQNWGTDESICTFYGITCLPGSQFVQSIQLGANNVIGTPPVELYQLPHLESLVLYSNPLGNFKFTWIKEAQSLKELVLDSTDIESLKGVERAPSLQILKSRFNNVRGGLGDITDLTSLEFLSVSNNHLTGTVPSDFDNIPNLQMLLLGNNHLEGDLNHVRFPSSLTILDMSGNDITGTIPNNFLTEFGNAAELAVDLSGNHLQGKIPNTLQRFQRLTLYVSNNLLSEVPKALCQNSNWNDGEVGDYGCDGIVCAKGTSSPSGRRTDDHSCTRCRHAHFIGSSICHTTSLSSSGDRRSKGCTLGIVVILLFSSLLMI